MKLSNQKGNIITISLIFVAIVITIFTFVIAVFMSHINNILYNLKLDMYSMNKSAIVAVNKYRTSMDEFSYSKVAYEKEFLKLLKSNYELNEDLENDKKLITAITIEEYNIYDKNQKDSFTKEKCNGRTIHTVLKVKIKPIILSELLEEIFVFTIHEDVALNSMIT